MDLGNQVLSWGPTAATLHIGCFAGQSRESCLALFCTMGSLATWQMQLAGLSKKFEEEPARNSFRRFGVRSLWLASFVREERPTATQSSTLHPWYHVVRLVALQGPGGENANYERNNKGAFPQGGSEHCQKIKQPPK